MEAEDLIRRFPRLYHIVADGSWDSIAERGLLSCSALLDLFEVPEPRRSAIEAGRRLESVVLEHPQHGRAVIRDNKPLLENRLAACLQDGLSPVDWYRLLNRRVFFWPTRKRVHTLLTAAAYRDAPQLVITLRTERLVATHRDLITLSSINSGATRPFAWPRGLTTFRSIPDFDWGARRRYGQSAIAEVAVDYAVENVVDLVEHVVRHLPDGDAELVWQVDE
jgi:hypothetical protein